MTRSVWRQARWRHREAERTLARLHRAAHPWLSSKRVTSVIQHPAQPRLAVAIEALLTEQDDRHALPPELPEITATFRRSFHIILGVADPVPGKKCLRLPAVSTTERGVDKHLALGQRTWIITKTLRWRLVGIEPNINCLRPKPVWGPVTKVGSPLRVLPGINATGLCHCADQKPANREQLEKRGHGFHISDKNTGSDGSTYLSAPNARFCSSCPSLCKDAGMVLAIHSKRGHPCMSATPVVVAGPLLSLAGAGHEGDSLNSV